MRSIPARIAACLLVVLLAPASLTVFAFALPPQYHQTYLCALQDKWDALSEAGGPRVVIAGGSGAAFGVRCDLLERELPGYRVVNLGLYAGLGTTVMLELAQPHLRAGDIVIFSPEQSAQTLSTYFNPEAMWQAADGRPELLTALGPEHRAALLGAFPAFAGDKARLFRDGAAPAGEGVYARSSFNAYGDIASTGREQNVMVGGFDPNMPITFDPDLPSGDFFAAVNAFSSWCAARGITVYYRFCPMNAAALPEGELSRLAAYTQSLQARLDCPVLGSPGDAVLEPCWFYDTNFHLNSAGAVVNTARLAQELKAALGSPAPVGIPLPSPPPLAQAELADGDNRDGDCFLYEPDGNALRLTGLTGEGRGRTSLTLPVSHNGLPVTSLSPQVFAGNPTIRELTVQSSIRGLEDGSFEGCTALARIVLRHAAPGDCPVGAGLLDGTSALVYVPQSLLSAYRTNYFWAVHAGRIRGEAGAGAETSGVPTPAPSPAPASGPAIRYEGNGGTLKAWAGDAIELPMDNAHLRVNTAQGASYFQRDGYVLTGWNTAADGSGVPVGLGSRTARRDGLTLYAQWAKASPETDFLWEAQGDQAWITGYLGSGGACVVPEAIRGLPVRRICAGAFQDADLTTLILPPSLYAVEPGAFTRCALRELTLSDSLREVSGESFSDCRGLITLHLSATVSPAYSGSYFAAFADKYDWLLSLSGQRKLILFSGSSGRYGYDSPALLSAFPEYQPANMGVYAYTNALPQLDLILSLAQEGDILLSAPEFDAAAEQFCASNRLDAHFWAMMEANYDAAAQLDLRQYSGVFDSLGEYLEIKRGMAGRSYSDSPASYDDDGNYYAFPTYNQYGDLILPRPNGEKDECLRHNIADYTTDSIPPAYTEALNAVYRAFLDKGIAVYFTYTPRNRWSLTGQSTPAARQALHQHLVNSLCVPVISDIEDSLYPGTCFYLIDSHLSCEGAAIRTQRVIEDLRPWIP